jgi:hypothetical protein
MGCGDGKLGPEISSTILLNVWPPLLRTATNTLQTPPVDMYLTSADVIAKSAEVCCMFIVLFAKAQTTVAMTIAATTRRIVVILSEIPDLLLLILLKALMRYHMLTNVT